MYAGATKYIKSTASPVQGDMLTKAAVGNVDDDDDDGETVPPLDRVFASDW